MVELYLDLCRWKELQVYFRVAIKSVNLQSTLLIRRKKEKHLRFELVTQTWEDCVGGNLGRSSLFICICFVRVGSVQMFLRLFLVEISFDRVENAVYKLRCFKS
jgi:hypothetical protein